MLKYIGAIVLSQDVHHVIKGLISVREIRSLQICTV